MKKLLHILNFCFFCSLLSMDTLKITRLFPRRKICKLVPHGKYQIIGSAHLDDETKLNKLAEQKNCIIELEKQTVRRSLDHLPYLDVFVFFKRFDTISKTEADEQAYNIEAFIEQAQKQKILFER
jgi:hypothetical protein